MQFLISFVRIWNEVILISFIQTIYALGIVIVAYIVYHFVQVGDGGLH